MTTTRKHLRITITGETYDDLVEALKEVHRKVEEEYISGFDRNEAGNYKFDITDYIAESVKCYSIWNELYRRTYDAYTYAAFCNEEVRETLGTLLDQLIDIKPKETK